MIKIQIKSWYEWVTLVSDTKSALVISVTVKLFGNIQLSNGDTFSNPTGLISLSKR